MTPQRLDRIMTEHSILVLVGDDPIPWDRCDPFKAHIDRLNDGTPISPTIYEPITLTRARADNTVDRIVDWANRLGETIEIRQTHLAWNGSVEETGHGLIVDGTVTGVDTADKDQLLRGVLTAAHLPMMDAASTRVALDRLIIQPTGIRPLTREDA